MTAKELRIFSVMTSALAIAPPHPADAILEHPCPSSCVALSLRSRLDSTDYIRVFVPPTSV